MGIIVAIFLIVFLGFVIWKAPIPKWVKIIFTILVVVFAVRECRKGTFDYKKETTAIETTE